MKGKGLQGNLTGSFAWTYKEGPGAMMNVVVEVGPATSVKFSAPPTFSLSFSNMSGSPGKADFQSYSASPSCLIGDGVSVFIGLGFDGDGVSAKGAPQDLSKLVNTSRHSCPHIGQERNWCLMSFGRISLLLSSATWQILSVGFDAPCGRSSGDGSFLYLGMYLSIGAWLDFHACAGRVQFCKQ